MNDGKIYITITEGPIGKGANGEGAGGEKDSSKAGSKLGKYASHEFLHLVRDETKRIINYRISTIGSRTGEYITQRNLQNAFNLANKGVNIAMAALVGFKATGTPIGAAIGAGVATILQATTMAFQIDEMYRQVRIQNQDIAILRHRAGLDNLNDGSRGTEN